jgi:hypothetical protein
MVQGTDDSGCTSQAGSWLPWVRGRVFCMLLMRYRCRGWFAFRGIDGFFGSPSRCYGGDAGRHDTRVKSAGTNNIKLDNIQDGRKCGSKERQYPLIRRL